MQSLAEQLQARPEFKVKAGARKVTHAYLHQPPMWPEHPMQDNSLTPVKYPNLKMLWIPGDGLILQDKDGSTTTVGAANVINVVHPRDA